MILLKKKEDSASGLSDVPLSQPATVEVNSENQKITLKATWLPVSMWNYIIIMILLLIFVVGSYWGKQLFNQSKWSNSSNSPYPKYEE